MVITVLWCKSWFPLSSFCGYLCFYWSTIFCHSLTVKLRAAGFNLQLSDTINTLKRPLERQTMIYPSCIDNKQTEGCSGLFCRCFLHSFSPPHVNICTPKRLNTSRFEKDSVSPPIAKESNNWEKDPSLASSLLIPQALFVQYQQPRAQVSAEEQKCILCLLRPSDTQSEGNNLQPLLISLFPKPVSE